MYIDKIDRLYKYIDRRFPEQKSIKISKKTFKRRVMERNISQEILLILYDRINTEPSYVLEDMLYYYIGLMYMMKRSRNIAQYDLYNMYERVITIMNNYINKEE